MKIKKVVFPKKSLLSQIDYNYTDSYCGDIEEKKRANITSTEVGNAFFTSSPKWIGILLSFRNKIVSIFGLKTGESFYEEKVLNIEKGEQLGIFKVFDKNETALILGEDDKHLDFRVSLLLEPQSQHKKKLIISTIVVFNNWFGKLYFLPVKLFHKLIVKSMLRNTIKELEH